MKYTELQVTTNFTFLRGASHPEELVEQAAILGYECIAITDRNTLAGVVRAYSAAKKAGIRVIAGCRLDLKDGASLLAYPTNKDAYSRLSGMLSLGNMRTEKGKCDLYKSDVYKHATGIKFIIVAPTNLNSEFAFEDEFTRTVAEYKGVFGQHVYLAASRTYQANDAKRLCRLAALSEEYGVPMAAVNDVHYHIPQRRELQDIMTCIREKCTIYTAGYKLHQNAERFLKPEKEMLRLLAQYPDALRHTQEIADACQFSLSELKYVYPEEVTNGRPAYDELEELAWKGANDFYGEPLPEKIITNINHELSFIKQMDYAPYFLTVYDIVRFARSKGILCQGRGSAANSTICFVLGITSVDPTKFNLLFERFISSARNEPPDIDMDFEHERREEVIQYIYDKYGRDRAGIVATVTQLHQKGAIRDVAKAMGMSIDAINRLSKSVWEFSDEWFEGKLISSQGFDPNDPHLRKILDLTAQFVGFPRQLGQHTGGFVITQDKLTDLCPILNARMEKRTNIEWNKDDIDALGFLKIDVLALGMLTCIRKCFDLAKQHYNLDLTLANIPQDDTAVYDMVSYADTIGVFQIESRAQQSMLPRLKPKNFYDLVIEVAIVRPGPIQGDMVHPYLRRRNGQEKVTYPSKDLEDILKRTLGVPLFQEQVMKIAIVAAGFTPAEADELRRSMATFKMKGTVNQFERRLVNGMIERGYTQEFATRIMRQLEGFGAYGFPESHAASFASLVYVSCWIKCYYPDIFATGLLNSQPMGFYQPAQLVSDARKHGVEVRPIDVNYSYWDNVLEEQAGKYKAVRLGFRQIKGFREEDATLLTAGRFKPYNSLHSLLNVGLPLSSIERLANADAFRSIGLDRRKAIWEASALSDIPTGMYRGQSADGESEKDIQLPAMSLPEHVIHDYSSTSLSLKAHPVSFVRQKLSMLNILTTQDLNDHADGEWVKVAGLVLVRQRPGTASGVCFITIEDETGCANLIVWAILFEKYRKEILHSTLLMVEGKLQREGIVTHVIVSRCFDMSKMLKTLSKGEREVKGLQTLSPADNNDGTFINERHPREKPLVYQGEIFGKGRNFK